MENIDIEKTLSPSYSLNNIEYREEDKELIKKINELEVYAFDSVKTNASNTPDSLISKAMVLYLISQKYLNNL